MSRPKNNKKKTKKPKSAVAKTNRCINPFQGSYHKGFSLRKVPPSIQLKFPDLPKYARICSKCRDRAAQCLIPNANEENEKIPMETETFNADSGNTGEFQDVAVNHSEKTNSEHSDEGSTDGEDDHQHEKSREEELEEMLEGLRKKYNDLNDRDPMRTRILTIAPASWSINQICREFGASKRQARKAKILTQESGVLGETKSKAKRSLKQSVLDSVKNFYNDDNNSRIMPGKNDCKSILVGNQKISVQKRLLLVDLRELYTNYKQLNLNAAVAFSTFCKLRPKNVILPGKSGSHIVCVCTIHENVKMMLEARICHLVLHSRITKTA